MAERDGLVTSSSRHVLPRQMEDAGTNNPQTTREGYEKELKTRESDHEKIMRHLKLDFSIQVDGLKREKEELQTTIDAFHMLCEKMRGEHTAEVQSLTQAMQLLWSELYAKEKELKVMTDAHDALVKKLDDERVDLPKKLADAAKHALALQPNAKPSNEAVAAKAAAPVPAHPKGKFERFAHCSQCMRHNWECDGGARCKNCSMRGIRRGCQRVACKYYSKGTCKDENCRFAHAGDGSVRIVPYEAVWGDGRELSPVELQKKGHKGGWKATWS